jgi:hypothetical protein
MRAKLLGLLAILSVSCADGEKNKSDSYVVELYSGGTIINVWHAKDIHTTKYSNSIRFTDVECGCETYVSGTYIVTPTGRINQ